jgi:translation initiation factor IF-1
VAKESSITVTGKVIDVLPGNKYRAKLDNTDKIIACYLSGRMRKNKIRVILGDAIEIDMSPYDMTQGRVTRRN